MECTVKTKIFKYGLYSFSFLIGVMVMLSAYYSFFIDQDIGLISYISITLSGVLCIPLVFIVIAKQSSMTKDQVLKAAVGLWVIGILLPMIGL